MPLFGEPAPDFSDPLGLLTACHRRILDHCALLERMRARLPQQGVDAEMQQAAQRVHRYFGTAAKHHHADEEEDLFPLLRRLQEVGGELAGVLAALETEHAVLEQHWHTLQPALARMKDGQAPGQWDYMVENFVAAYRRHVETEDRVVLPAARETLTPGQLADMGRAMATRRGVKVSG